MSSKIAVGKQKHLNTVHIHANTTPPGALITLREDAEGQYTAHQVGLQLDVGPPNTPEVSIPINWSFGPVTVSHPPPLPNPISHPLARYPASSTRVLSPSA